MTDRALLWNQYYAAMAKGNGELARQILKQIEVYGERNVRHQSGCSSCRKRF